MRKVGVHELRGDDVGIDTVMMAVVELEGKRVVRWYPLVEEQPQTEWIGGTVVLRRNKQGFIQAFKNNRLLC